MMPVYSINLIQLIGPDLQFQLKKVESSIGMGAYQLSWRVSF